MIETAKNGNAPGARGSIAVTGGTGDIGLEICRALASTGVEPVAIDLDPPEVGERKLSASGVTAAYRQADVTDRKQLGGTLKSIAGLVGTVANAGVVDSAPFLEVTEEQWAHHLAVNLTGAFNTAQAAARLFVETGVRGRLVFVTSWVHARGQDQLVTGAERIPLRRLQTAEEVAAVVAFLFSPAAAIPEDVPLVVELRGGDPGVDGQAVTSVAASWVGDGTVVRASSRSIATASFASSLDVVARHPFEPELPQQVFYADGSVGDW